MRLLVYTLFITNNRASFHFWLKQNLVKHQKVPQYYFHDCRLSKFMQFCSFYYELNSFCTEKLLLSKRLGARLKSTPTVRNSELNIFLYLNVLRNSLLSLSSIHIRLIFQHIETSPLICCAYRNTMETLIMETLVLNASKRDSHCALP